VLKPWNSIFTVKSFAPRNTKAHVTVLFATEKLYVTYVREKLMWDQCVGAHEIPSAHEIEGIGVKEFFTV
jgi:hypothetical protein